MRYAQDNFQDPMPKIAVGVGAFLLLVFGCAFAFWASRTYQDGGAVEALHWEHHTYRDNFQLVGREDWQANLSLRPAKMPVNGTGEIAGIDNIHNCYQKFHHTDRVYTGQTCSGSGKNRHCHSNYRHVPVNRPWCSYDTWDWVSVEDVPRQGDNTDTEWGTVTPGPLDRPRRVGTYDVTIGYFDTEKVRYEHVEHPKSEPDFKSWHVGEHVQVEVYNIGFVRDVIRVELIPVEAS
jgi:hypothetical protein